ncbi:MAG: type II toxin-antitoxin system HicA family toxin [Firmicutes bacterium]|nr:type II toxin-antitoxin system HicA family toxin [Bacillota bacterium]
MKRRDLIKKLEKLGYKLKREGSEHTVFTKKGRRQVHVPRHNEVDERTAAAILEIASGAN